MTATAVWRLERGRRAEQTKEEWRRSGAKGRKENAKPEMNKGRAECRRRGEPAGTVKGLGRGFASVGGSSKDAQKGALSSLREVIKEGEDVSSFSFSRMKKAGQQQKNALTKIKQLTKIVVTQSHTADMVDYVSGARLRRQPRVRSVKQ